MEDLCQDNQEKCQQIREYIRLNANVMKERAAKLSEFDSYWHQVSIIIIIRAYELSDLDIHSHQFNSLTPKFLLFTQFIRTKLFNQRIMVFIGKI